MQLKNIFEQQVQCCIQSKPRKLDFFSSVKAFFTHTHTQQENTLAYYKVSFTRAPHAVGVQMGPVFFDETNSHNFVKLSPDNMFR